MLFSLFKRAFSLLLLFVLVACEVDRPPLPELEPIHEVLWKTQLQSGSHSTNWAFGEPVYWNNQLVYFSSQPVDGQKDVWVFADADNGNVIATWYASNFDTDPNRLNPYIPEAVVIENHLLVQAENGVIYAIDLNTHQTVWQCGSCGVLTDAQWFNNRIYMIVNGQRIRMAPMSHYMPQTVLDVSNISWSVNLQQFHVFTLPNGDTAAAVLIGSGFNEVRSGLYNFTTSQYMWRDTVDRPGAVDDSPSWSKPFVLDSLVIFTTSTHIRAYNLFTGVVEWEVNNSKGFAAPVNGSIFCIDKDGYGKVLDRNGTRLFANSDLGQIDRRFQFSRFNNSLLFTGNNNSIGAMLYGVNMSDASPLFPMRTAISFHNPIGSIAVDSIGNRLFFADANGIVCMAAPNP